MYKRLVFIFLSLIIWVTAGYSADKDAQEPKNRTLRPKQVHSFKNFQQIAILENGRIKPLDTYARNLLLQFSGKRSFEKESAGAWLARLLFAPGATRDDKIFLINNPAIPEALGIKADPKRRYSFAAIEPVISKLDELSTSARAINEKQRDIVESELIRLYENIKLYSQLSFSFSFAFPSEDFTIYDHDLLTQLGLLPNKLSQYSFLDISLNADKIQAMTVHLATSDSTQWNDQEKALVNLVHNLYRWSNLYHEMPFMIIPSATPGSEAWESPWDAMTNELASEQGRKELSFLRDMVIAYWNGEQLSFDISVNAFSDSVNSRLNEKGIQKVSRIPLEIFYNQSNPFLIAKGFYFLSLFFFFMSFIVSHHILYRIGIGALLLGFIPHLLAILARVTILQRPPVSNLYETFIFVGFVSVVAGIIIEYFNKQWLGIVISSICGLIFLTIAEKFSADGDTLQMLVAVLNSNFWLSTHVLSITIGYAGACVAGIAGHIYILQSIFQSKESQKLTSTYHILIGTLGFGLAMTFLGTNLGGIWADESWGRFWGWDPKENGALLIVIWTALLFHLKISKLIGPLGLAVGSVLGIIVVMWAWFGVNLLSIGLHSYGFASGLATNLLIYVILQLLFLGITVPIARKRLSQSKS